MHNDNQLVMEAARTLPVEKRDVFLQRIATMRNVSAKKKQYFRTDDFCEYRIEFGVVFGHDADCRA